MDQHELLSLVRRLQAVIEAHKDVAREVHLASLEAIRDDLEGIVERSPLEDGSVAVHPPVFVDVQL